MTTQEKIEDIRQKCIEANPEIMELKFGCRVQNNRRGDMGYILAQEFNSNVYYNEDTKQVLVRDFEPDEIIGRPIRLADVLLAAREVSERIEGQLFVADNGMFCIAKVGKSLDGLGYWNLAKDDLTLQGKPTIDFIHDLLK